MKQGQEDTAHFGASAEKKVFGSDSPVTLRHAHSDVICRPEKKPKLVALELGTNMFQAQADPQLLELNE